MLTLRDLSHGYRLRGRRIDVLRAVTHTFAEGSFSSIRGASGSGKSTLLNILGLLETPSAGRYAIGQEDTATLLDRSKSALRARTFGYLFQDFRLLPNRTVLENVRLSLDILADGTAQERQARAMNALERVGLGDRAEHLPPELSGGEAQRAAFARALVKEPAVLLADEPTGNLDANNRDRVLALIEAFHGGGGTVILVTHDPAAAQVAESRLRLEAGRLLPYG